MTNQVTLKDVAQAAGISISTVSLVMNGKADTFRISPTTQARIRSIALQLGYQPNLVARDIVLRKPFRGVKPQSGSSDVKSQMAETKPGRQQIGVILSPTSTSETLGLIPGLIPVLTAAGYRLVVMTTDPADPATVRTELIPFLSEGVAGLLCCPTVYSSVSEIAGGMEAGAPSKPRSESGELVASAPSRIPVIVLYSAAGKAMLNAVNSGQLIVDSGEKTIEDREHRIPTPIVSVPPPKPVVVISKPVIKEARILTPEPPLPTDAPALTPPPIVEFAPLGSSVDADVPAALVTSMTPSGTNAAETAASTWVSTPEAENPATTPQEVLTEQNPPSIPVQEPDPASTPVVIDAPRSEPEPVVEPTPPPTVESAPLGSRVDADVPAALATSMTPSGTNAAETAASTWVPAPEAEIPAPPPQEVLTEQNPPSIPAQEPDPVSTPVVIDAPISEPEPVVELTPPPIVESAPLGSQVDADVPAALATNMPTSGTNAAEAAASTWVPAPEAEIPAPTPQEVLTEQNPPAPASEGDQLVFNFPSFPSSAKWS